MPKVKFYTLGCKVNQYETQEMRECLLRGGISFAADTAAADIVVVNTCTVTHKTDAQCFSLIRRVHRENPRAFLIAAGCLAERDGKKLAGLPYVQLVLKNRDKPRIVEILRRHKRFARIAPPVPQEGISAFQGHTRAFLKIQDGCDNRCSYCKVWLVRGPSRSRPAQQVVTEAERLCASGFKEIVLCGICLGAYGRDLSPKCSLIGLIEELCAVPQLGRIRLSSLEAGDLDSAFIRRCARIKKLCRHLHIPMQSGSDRILKSMNRRYRRRDYLALISSIRRQIPDCAISTDILIGFPGEEEADFRDTLELVRRIAPMRVHAFAYSPRPGTPAYARRPIAPPVVKQRLRQLGELSRQYAVRFAGRLLKTPQEVLFEQRLKEGRAWFWQGYTDTYLRVRVRSSRDLENRLITVRPRSIRSDKAGVYLFSS